MSKKIYVTVPVNPDYWDCECEHNFVHKRSELAECVECGALEDDQPDSRVNEVIWIGTK